MQIIENAGQRSQPGRMGTRWVEDFRADDVSVGTYTIEAFKPDPQGPHTEDEIYVVVSGRARFVADTGEAGVGPGTVIYVPAGETHKFVDVSEDLVALVVFAPAEGSRTAPDDGAL